MKKFITIALALLSFVSAWADGAKGYYEQNARKSDKIVVFNSTVTDGNEDGSDLYLADVVRKAMVADLQIYSNYTVIDFLENNTHKAFVKDHSTCNTKEISEVANAYEAKYAVSIETTIDRSLPQESLSIAVTIFIAENNGMINGYTSSIPWNRTEYLEFAHREATYSLLPQLDITLTSLGERLLLGTATPANLTLEDAIAEEEDINLQLSRTAKNRIQKLHRTS